MTTDIAREHAKEEYRKIIAYIAVFFIGTIFGAVIIGATMESDYSKRLQDSISNITAKANLWLVYNDYSLAMRDIEAAADLITTYYYLQYLPTQYKLEWDAERLLTGSPRFYADDAMEQLDNILEKLTSTDWPEEYRDEITKLNTYITELRQLAIKMQQIANKNTYTKNDVNEARTISDMFEDYNYKIYNLIKEAP